MDVPPGLAGCGDISDTLGVDVYPVTLATRDDPNLHAVGVWTHTISALTQNHSVWTTLQICPKYSYDTQTGIHVLPSAYQERYMVYDAIINGGAASPSSEATILTAGAQSIIAIAGTGRSGTTLSLH